jgi:hypothetical protein
MGDYCYAVMDKTPKAMTPNRTACPAFPNCTQDCQIEYIEMPPGWELAPCPSNEVTAAMFSGVCVGRRLPLVRWWVLLINMEWGRSTKSSRYATRM